MDPGLTVIHLGIRLGIGENRHFLAFEILKKNLNNSEIFHEIFHRQKNRHFYNSNQRAFAPCHPPRARSTPRHLPPPLQPPAVSWTIKRLIVHDKGGGWRSGRRKETVTLHQSPVTPRRSVLGHGHVTDDAAPHPPAGSDKNSLNYQSLTFLRSNQS